MSQTQLLAIPAELEEEETGVVERFMEASRDLVPSVQITLAKRIIRPGSNRVVCLAARTSIPLNDDELASVSDLALRLSDGTNVALSLSFFNDGSTASSPNYASESRPLNRYYYNPADYTKKNESKLGLVICGLAFVAALGIFAFVHKPISSSSPLHATSKLIGHALPPVAAGHSLKATTMAFAAGTEMKIGTDTRAPQSGSPNQTLKYPKAKKQPGLLQKLKPSGHAKTSQPLANKSGSMLVPPPPPTPYSFGGGVMPFFDPSQIPCFPISAATAPRAAADTKSRDTKPKDSKPTDSKPKDAKAGDTKAIDTRARASIISNSQSGDTSPKKIKSDDSRSRADSNIQSKPESTKIAGEHKAAGEHKVSESLPPASQPVQRMQKHEPDEIGVDQKVYRSRETQVWPNADKMGMDNSKSDRSTAPVPGDDETSMQLERIVPQN